MYKKIIIYLASGLIMLVVLILGSPPGQAAFLTGGADYWVVNGTNTYNTTGNVGIGKSNPVNKLDVTGAIGTGLTGASNRCLYVDPNGVISAKSADCGTATGDTLPSGSIGQTLRHNGTSWTNNSIIFNNGTNIGIGTTVPGDKLVVSNGTGEVRFGGSNGRTLSAYTSLGALANFDFYAVSTYFDSSFILATKKQIQMYNYAGTNSDYARMYVPVNENLTFRVNGSDRVSINSSGNVGIGTTDPTRKLTVVGTAAEIMLMTGPNTNGLMLQDISSPAMASFLGYDGTAYNAIEFRATAGFGSQLYLGTNGNIGIGTTAPAQKLQVVGSVQATSFIGNASTATSLAANGANCSAGYYPLGVDASGAVETCTVAAAGGSLPSGTLGQTLRSDGTNWLANSNLYNNGTNVGIGAASPAERLHILGSAAQRVEVESTGSSAAFKMTSTLGSYGFISSSAANLFSVYDYNTSTYRLNITGTGNVGVGTSAPTGKLDVSDAVGGGLSTAGDLVVDTSGTGTVYLGRLHPTSGYNTTFVFRDRLGSVKSRWENAGAGSIGYGNFTDGYGVLIQDNAFSGSIGSLGSLFKVDSTGYAYPTAVFLGGNVGIGTTAPVQQLHSAGYVRADTGFCIGATCITSWPAGGSGLPTGSNAQTLRHNGTDWVADSNLVNSGANVGIGVTAPNTKLYIQGGNYHQIAQKNSGASQVLWSGAVWDTVGSYVANNAYYNSSFTYIPNYTAASGIAFRDTGAIEFFADSGLTAGVSYNPTERMTITPAGNVGIGLTNPAYKFQVTGTSYLNGQVTTSLTGTGNRCVYVDASGNVLAKTTDCGTATGGDNLGDHIATQNIRLGSYWLSGDGGAEGVAVTAAGNVGIGFSAPTQTLSVNGSLSVRDASADRIIVTFNEYSSGEAKLKTIAGAGWVLESDHSNAPPMVFRLGNGTVVSERMRIMQSGNVGIGTSAPAQMLHVAGNVQATSFIGNASTASALAANPANCSAGYYPLGVNASGAVESCTLAGAGGSLPTGTAGQTFRHDGTSWVGNSVIFNNGTNIGIGTTAPGYKLDITGNVNVSGAMYISSADFQLMPQLYLSYEDNAVKYASDYNTVFTRNANRHLSFDHPQENYNVVYFQSATSPDVSNNEWGSLGHDTNNFLIKTGVNVGTGTAPTTKENAIVFSPRGTERMRITGAGNVGIGVTNPTYKLQVVGTSYLNGQVTTALSGTGNRCVYVDATGNLLAKTADCGTATGGDNLGDHIATQNIRLGSYWLSGDGGAEGVFVTAAGNVGVGLTNPAQRLQVSGSVQATSFIGPLTGAVTGNASTATALAANGTNCSAGYYPLGVDASGNSETCTAASGGTADGLGTGNSGTTNYVTKWTGTTAIGNSVIYDNGTNIGIGNTAPGSYKLNVTGNVYANSSITTAGYMVVAGGNVYDDSGDLHVMGEDSLYLKMDYNNDDANTRNIIFAKNTTAGTVPTAANELMRITEAGNVGIGTTTINYKLRVEGSISALNDVIANAFVYSSDRNLKTNIKTIDDSLEKITSLRGVYFNWKKDGINSDRNVGLIAQEVEKVFPEVVSDAGGSKGVEYGNLVAPLIEAIKEQQEQIEDLKARIKRLEALIP